MTGVTQEAKYLLHIFTLEVTVLKLFLSMYSQIK